MRNLDILYQELDFNSGDLQTSTDNPSTCSKSIDWLEKGEWLAASKRAGIEKIFFIENNPVVVFAECEPGLLNKVKAFNRAWCLARPRLLFLSSPGEITIYDLAQEPFDEEKEEEWEKIKPISSLNEINKISKEWPIFHRDNIESGNLFSEIRFGDLRNRADKSLIRDLKIVRRELINAGLSDEKVRFAHTLIGRSIFIRYLEDRGILTEEYFYNIAKNRLDWLALLNIPATRTGVDSTAHNTYYPRVLSNKDFTYALFKALACDFNGDMFPGVDEEEKIVSLSHLSKIQDLLYGDTGPQKKLFFHAYRFDIVPLDLISSIYEEFYHSSTVDNEMKAKARQDGAYYTPPVLAEFVLSHVLTSDIMALKPRILDPACGSGIFLVEAFRRIVRYEWYNKKAPLTFSELNNILREQIAGIEVNEEAARITAFSLYLSTLHYLDPPAIHHHIEQGNTLPSLLASQKNSDNQYNCILVGNSFDLQFIESNHLWKNRFGNACADVIVGNPPWGSINTNNTKAHGIAKERQKVLIKWCKEKDKPIGDIEQSQAFLWRALDFLKDNGRIGMLVTTGILFKHNRTTKSFREKWFDTVCLEQVYNFTHVRKLFFRGSISPFIFVMARKERQNDNPLYYWSVKNSMLLNNTQSVLLSKHDCNILRGVDLTKKNVWKIHLWGNNKDYDFISYLTIFKPLKSIVDRNNSGQGFKVNPQKTEANQLKGCQQIDIKSFSRYEPLSINDDTPQKVYRMGNVNAYNGLRLLVKRGISERNEPKGQIICRYETEKMCFSSAIVGLKLLSESEEMYKLILGILWSSLSRYFFFMTSSTWGIWHDEIDIDEELLQLPIVVTNKPHQINKIISIVNKLSSFHPHTQNILNPDGVSSQRIKERRMKWERDLDDSVFELYELNEEQKDLIRDCCDVTLPFFYKPLESIGSMPAVELDNYKWIKKYIDVFSRRWNAYLDEEEMRAQIHIGAHRNMIAIEFYPADREDAWNLQPNQGTWEHILDQLGVNLPQPMGTSQILLDGIVHIISREAVIIIKRNEKRLWTRSLAREDAEATICKMITTIKKDGIG